MLFDLLCAFLALLFLVLGAIRGLIRQLFGLAGFIGGLLLARLFAGVLGTQFAPDLGLSPALATVGFAFAIFFAVEVIATLLGNYLHDHLGLILGTANRIGGGALGLAKGLLFVWALASLAALLHTHAAVAEQRVGFLGKLDLAHSRAVQLAREENFLGDLESQFGRAVNKLPASSNTRAPGKRP
jgi:uncharacterized membrane protein required for colicin V production